ncbi:unnamed protein product [Rotaria sp. Silwood2]|nr:unnamed protein product [Rotaria sp. Silwood2]
MKEISLRRTERDELYGHRECVPRGSQTHPRPIGSATFVCECLPNNQLFKTSGESYINKPKTQQHLFYTLPCIFNEFPELCPLDRYINDLQSFTFLSPDKIVYSRLVKLTMSHNLPSSIPFFSHIVSSNQITELHLLRCDREISVNLPSVTHPILIDSLDSLNSGSFSSNIRFVQITLLYDCLPFAKGDWTALHCLSILPQLHSPHVLLYDMRTPPDDTSLQIIADITPMISNFAFCFRRRYNHGGFDIDLVYTEHSLFIEKLRQRILAFEQRKEPYFIVDEDGCGLIM